MTPERAEHPDSLRQRIKDLIFLRNLPSPPTFEEALNLPPPPASGHSPSDDLISRTRHNRTEHTQCSS